MLQILKYSSWVLDKLQPILLLLGVEKKGLVGLYTYVYGTLLGYSDTVIKIIIAQAALETGWFTHVRFTEYNNAFGMRKPSVRDTTAADFEYNNHATYRGVASGVIDRFLRDDHFNAPHEGILPYINYLIRTGYATDPGYQSKLQALLQTSNARIDDIYGEAYRAGLYLGAIIIAGVFVIYKKVK